MEKQFKVYSLVFCRRISKEGPELLLGLKRRGFGTGKMNGYGGKKEHNETIRECAKRELFEESGLVVAIDDLEHVASLEFNMDSLLMLVEVFFTSRFEGEAITSDEMIPSWTLEKELPVLFKEGKTWADDELWLPQVLSGLGGRICGRFTYNPDNSTISSYSIFPHQELL